MQTYVELMIFDFDGTLVTTGEDIANSVNNALNSLNLKTINKDEIMTFIGDGAIKLIERAISEADKAYREKALEIYMDHYDRHMLDHAALYPGVYEILNYFKGKRKIILTNKQVTFTKKIASELNILSYFEEIIGAESTPFKKPDSRLMETIFKRYEIKRENMVIIGDGINDILMAKNSGVMSCCYLNGLGRREDLIALNPDIGFEHFDELKDMLI
jgi:phosphoglycolate phosphatase